LHSRDIATRMKVLYMTKRWEDLEDGRVRLTITSEGAPTSVFYGANREEIADKLADAQAHANAELSRRAITRPATNGHSSAIEPKPLSPGERMQTVADLTNPAKVDQAVTRVLESVIGPVDKFQQDREDADRERVVRAQVAAAYQFWEEMGSQWLPTPYNKETLYNYMVTQGLDLGNIDHYKRAFATLDEKGLLERPAETLDTGQSTEVGLHRRNAENPDDSEVGLHRRNAENPAPRIPARYSTGVRSSDVSGAAPIPSKRLKYSREQIEALSLAKYRQLMVSDPEFSRCVEYYSKPRSGQRRATV
jgi:hypothetical protein